MFRAGIYVGWAGFGSLGEEATFQLCRRRFPAIDWSPFNAIDYTTKPAQFIRQRGLDLKQIRRVVSEELSTQRRLRALAARTKLRLIRLGGAEVGICGGDTVINRNAASLRAYTEVRKRTGSPVPIFGTGVAHPDFWVDRDPEWADRRKDWISLFEDLPVVGVRGPYSKAYLEEAGASNVVVCGDPAVALHARYANRSPRVRRNGSLRIGVNVGVYTRTWGTQNEIQSSVTALARWLREAGHRVEIIPAWHRDEAACVESARQSGLDSSAIHRACASHEDFLVQIEELDLMVACNMHAGILSAVANVPFVSIEHQPKCRDFAASIGWEEFLLNADRLQPAALIERVEALIGQLDFKRTQLCKAMCVLGNTFERYCDQIEPLLLK
jgi:Polysaccharide pyruvyl transferase